MGAFDLAAALREEALQLYRGELCEGSANDSVAGAARVLEERYVRAALLQGDYWRSIAHAARRQVSEIRVAASPGSLFATGPIRLELRSIWREALRNYERVLEVDSYHEEAYMRAMECQAHLGNARGVDRLFHQCREVARADLLQAPGPEVVSAYRKFKDRLSRGGPVIN